MRLITRLLTAFLWLAAAVAATAQPARPVAQPAPPPAPIVLQAPSHHLPVDGHGRYWIDASGRQTADEVDRDYAALPWAVRNPGASHDIDGGKAFWVAFEAEHKDATQWFVELEISGLDRVQLFYRDRQGRWVVQEAGDSKPVSEWPIPGRFPTFELSQDPDRVVRYYLRIEHARVQFAAAIELYDQQELLATREREQFLLGGYFGLALLIAIVSAANGIVFRDRNFGAYAIYVSTLAIYQAAYLGIGAEHLWPQSLKWNEVATFVLPGITTATALWFTKVVTEPARYSPALDLVVWSVIFAVLAAVGLDTAISSRATLLLVLVLTLVAMAVIAMLVVLVWRKGEDPVIRVIALGFVPVLIAALLPVARGLNLIPTTFWTRYALALGAGMEMPILYYALTLRGARRREAQMRASALPGNDPLTGLGSKQTLAHRLESTLARAASLKHSAALLGVRITNLDQLGSEFGRETVDRALVVAASLLRRATTDIDFAARVGEHDFMLLLEGPTTRENALSRAQQLVASGLRSSEALPPGTVLKFHVTVAMLPDSGQDAASTLLWLGEALNSARPDARKLIRPLNF